MDIITESVTHGRCDARTYGYLPGRSALPLPFDRYLLPIRLRVGRRVGLGDRLDTKTNERSPISVLTGLDVTNFVDLITPLLLRQTTTASSL